MIKSANDLDSGTVWKPQMMHYSVKTFLLQIVGYSIKHHNEGSSNKYFSVF